MQIGRRVSLAFPAVLCLMLEGGRPLLTRVRVTHANCSPPMPPFSNIGTVCHTPVTSLSPREVGYCPKPPAAHPGLPRPDPRATASRCSLVQSQSQTKVAPSIPLGHRPPFRQGSAAVVEEPPVESLPPASITTSATTSRRLCQVTPVPWKSQHGLSAPAAANAADMAARVPFGAQRVAAVQPIPWSGNNTMWQCNTQSAPVCGALTGKEQVVHC